MIVFLKQANTLEETHIILLFGVGLIGTSICKNINKRAKYSSLFFPFSWNHPEQSRKNAATIIHHLSNTLDSRSTCTKRSSCKIAFVWSAGKAGFTATKKNIENELTNYEYVLNIVKTMRVNYPSISISVHLLSSIGGLFEGQRLVHDSLMTPQPIRYYGLLKFKQEKRLFNLDKNVIKKVYRPTSVYGYIGTGHRMGLIPTLIINGLQNKTSTIFGSFSTLRDYVFNDDIGSYIEKNLFDDLSEEDTGVYLLASGKPSSIYEIKHFVEQVVGRKIFLEFRTTGQTDNNADITTNSSLLPINWSPRDLKIGIRYVKEKIIGG